MRLRSRVVTHGVRDPRQINIISSYSIRDSEEPHATVVFKDRYREVDRTDTPELVGSDAPILAERGRGNCHQIQHAAS